MQKWIIHHGAVRGALAITTLSILASWLITFSAMKMFSLDDELAFGMIIATLCPLFIAPVVSYVMLKLMIRLHHTEQLAQRVARMDMLTGVMNRPFFFRYVRNDMDERSHEIYGLFLVDLDFFKSINDQLGHLEGDRVLVTICNTVKRELLENESIGRFGGDEFVLWMHDETIESLRQRAERICACCVEDMRLLYPESDIVFSLSIGGASSVSGKPSFDELLLQADQNLYAAKQAGRGRVVMT